MGQTYGEIGARLRAARGALRLSRREVVGRLQALGCPLSEASLKDFEDGERLNLPVLLQLAAVLGRTPEDLLGLPERRDLEPEDLRQLAAASTRMTAFEKEFLFAAFNHIQQLRSRGLRELADLPRPAGNPGIRQRLIAILERGGAFSLKELQLQPQLRDVSEMALHETALDLARVGVLEIVTHRPTRFCLRPGQLERLLE